MLLEVLKFPDPRLRIKCKPIVKVTSELAKFAEDMLETMYANKGIGLAAAQVNRPVRFLVIDTRPRDEGGRYDLSQMTELEKQVQQPLFLFNPQILVKEGKTTYDEGCLSVPTYFETVERYEYIEVKGLNLENKEFLVKVDGLLSICIQHEIDHLDGKLFIDRLSTIKSNRIKSKIKKFGYPSPEKEDEDNLEHNL
ncbi:MAG: peptide deformylase [Bdellovibrionaceae bacterium]|nr:peptide deformylase [Pseudobdellovibrionaceae bacterium]